MTCETASGSHAEVRAARRRAGCRRPGSTDTGSIMHLPIFWRTEKAFLKEDMFRPLVWWSGSASDRERARAPLRADSAASARSASSLAGVEAQRTDLRLHRRDRRQADAQLVHAEADEDRHGRADRWRCRRTRPRVCRRLRALDRCAMSRSTAGFRPSTCGASFGCPRSIASVYCVRSLVPMEKKSASRANCAAITAVGRDFHHDAGGHRRHAEAARPLRRASPSRRAARSASRSSETSR